MLRCRRHHPEGAQASCPKANLLLRLLFSLVIVSIIMMMNYHVPEIARIYHSIVLYWVCYWLEESGLVLAAEIKKTVIRKTALHQFSSIPTLNPLCNRLAEILA